MFRGPLVTVFITAYNCEKYIAQALESIINQTYKNIEILVIDDCSSDNTVRIIHQYKEREERLTYIVNEKKMGIPYNRRMGVELARGKYLAIMDADDVSMLKRIETQVAYMEKRPEIMAVGSYYKLFGKALNHVVKKIKLQPQEIKICLIFNDPILNSSAMIRLDQMKELKINYHLDYFVSQDYGLWADISKSSNIDIIPKILVKYRTGHNNITAESLKQKRNQRKKIIDRIHNELLDYYQFELYEHEKETFNLFFAEIPPALNEDFIKKTKEIIKKMIEVNTQKRIFEPNLFRKIANRSIELNIRLAQVNVLKRIKFWSELSDQSKFGIIIKSFYFSLRIYIKKLIYNLK